MNNLTAVQTVRSCLAAVKPAVNMDQVANDTPLLIERVISSFDILELVLHLEQISGAPLDRTQFAAGSFRDIETIARTFLQTDSGQ